MKIGLNETEYVFFGITHNHCLTLPKQKAERLEKMRDDPYYIMDNRATKPQPNGHDIDSIPVVQLDDMPPIVRPGECDLFCFLLLYSSSVQRSHDFSYSM